ncbi:MAG: tRNA(His) guanylyltransferase Thg1 family protein [Anaerostipes caccae]|jgi:tRNA(His) 5'-end guanylyltransferase
MYFKKAEEKYYKYLSPYKPLVVRLDAVEATKSHQHHLVPCDRQTDNFMEALIDTAKQLSEEYHCSAFASTDEINLIFPIAPVTTRQKKLNVMKVGSIVVQNTFMVFNSIFQGERIFFDAKVFHIPHGKQEDYLQYRKKMCENTAIHYLAKDYFPAYMRAGKKLEDLKLLLKQNGIPIPGYATNGRTFYN